MAVEIINITNRYQKNKPKQSIVLVVNYFKKIIYHFFYFYN